MLELDGGDAGGQFVRSAVALSTLTGRPVRIENVRGARENPGLKPQHCAAVGAAAAACDADVEGVEEGSATVTFEPGAVTGGTVTATVGTAGSITLVFDTLLPLSLALDRPLAVEATGGTDVQWAPPAATYRRVKLPLLRAHGVPVAADLDRRGFYPVGGGAATLTVAPADPSPLNLTERGDPEGVRVYSLAAADLADAEVAERQADAAIENLPDDRTVTERALEYADAPSPGSVCTIRADYAGSTAGFDALGERGRPAEDVGTDAAAALRAFEATGAAVDEHLADQLLVFLAFVGGAVAVPRRTDHVRSSLELLAAFDCECEIEERSDATVVRGERRWSTAADCPWAGEGGHRG